MSKKLVQQQFGRTAAEYVTSQPHAKGKSLQRLLALTNPQPPWQMLDLATGAGHTALAFAPYVAHVVAADITTEMMEQAAALAAERGLTNVSTQSVDAENIPFADRTFDLVTCRIAAHHFPDIPHFVSEAARVLKPGGLLAVVDNVVPPGAAGDYVNAFEKLRDPSHGRCLSLDEWVQAFHAAGLSGLHQETLAKTMAFDSWARRMVRDDETRQQVQTMLLEAPAAAADFLQPQQDDELTFQLLEAIVIGEMRAEVSP